MKKNEMKNIKTKEIKELETMVSKKKLEIVKNQAKMLGGKEKNLKLVKNLKKEVAQLLTVIKERSLVTK